MNNISTVRNTVAPTESPERIKPVSSYVRHDNAPYVKISPHKTIRNAAVIYNAIKDKEPSEVIRGDFNTSSDPIIYFPKKEKRKWGCVSSSSGMTDGRVQGDREELVNFLRTITHIAQKSALLKSGELTVLAQLNELCVKNSNGEHDFTVGDIREALGVLAKTCAPQSVKKLTSPNVEKDTFSGVEKSASSGVSPQKLNHLRFDRKALQDFIGMDQESSGKLITQLPTNDGTIGLQEAMLAVVEIKRLVNKYLGQKPGRIVPFVDLLCKESISKSLHAFAKRWVSIEKTADATKIFSDEPWVAEIDKICSLVVKQSRRSFTISGSVNFIDLQRGFKESSRKSSAMPPLPSTPSPAFVKGREVISSVSEDGGKDLAEPIDVSVEDSSAMDSNAPEGVSRAAIFSDAIPGASGLRSNSIAESSFSINLSHSDRTLEYLKRYENSVNGSMLQNLGPLQTKPQGLAVPAHALSSLVEDDNSSIHLKESQSSIATSDLSDSVGASASSSSFESSGGS